MLEDLSGGQWLGGEQALGFGGGRVESFSPGPGDGRRGGGL